MRPEGMRLEGMRLAGMQLEEMRPAGMQPGAMQHRSHVSHTHATHISHIHGHGHSHSHNHTTLEAAVHIRSREIQGDATVANVTGDTVDWNKLEAWSVISTDGDLCSLLNT
jgi:hypothetical protein